MASQNLLVFFPAKVFCGLRALSNPETLEALKSFETRSDDVILAIFLKMGEAYLLD